MWPRRRPSQSQIQRDESMTRMDGTRTAKARGVRGVACWLLRGLSGLLERRAGMLFHPAGNLRAEAGAGHWRSEGFDSYFYVPMRCQAGRLLVSFDATLCDTAGERRDLWRLYFDTGEGFREEDCLVVGWRGARIAIETAIDLPAPVLAFRIDPSEQGGRFVLHKLVLTPLAVSQPPSDDAQRRFAQLDCWGALLRKVATARRRRRGRWRTRRQGAVARPLARSAGGA
jgi:hypothetical protein